MIEKKLIGKLPTFIGAYDSSKVYGKKNRVTLYGSEFESLIDNNTYAPATLDNDSKVVTFDTEHWTVISNGTGAFLAGEKLDQFSFQENPEFVSAKTDSDGNMVESTNVEGKKTFYGDVEVKGNFINEALKDRIEEYTDSKVDKEDGKSLIDKNVSDSLSEEDNSEYIAVNIDIDNKVIDSVDNNGIVRHNTKHIFKNGIEDATGKIIEDAYNHVLDKSSDLAKVLREKGDITSPTDWSDKKRLEIPEPRCAYINITSSDGTAATWPTTKTANKKYWMQFWDMQGNYFKKRIILNAQGNSSMGMPKKNGAIDLCNDEWIGDDTFSIKFGDWVSQDSFHIKGYYADYFIGIGAVGYSLFKDIINTRGIYNNRDWKRYLLPSLEAIGTNSQATANLNDNITISNDATCFPQGFPSIVFLDGKFYGIYSWQIKKHRDNYQMKKDNYSEIHLDGMISYDTLFNLNGNLDWDIITSKKAAPSGGTDGFEIRNPKKLICIDGKKYDADTHNVEIIGENSEKYDSTNADMVNTAKVKTSIINLSKYIPTLQSMVDGGRSNEDIRAKIEEYFDTISIIDYCIFGDLTYNADGYRKNWQWITYNGSKWLVEPYDLDSIFGWNTWGSPSPSEGQLGTNMTIPTGWVLKYYSNELQARYKELRDKKIIDADNIIKKLQDDWIERIGSENYKEDHNKWPYNKATYSAAATEYTRKDSIYRVYNWITQRITKCDTLYDYNV